MIRVESDLWFIVTDQRYEVSCHDKNFVLCPMRFALLRGDKMFAVAWYHAVVCDAFIQKDSR